MELNDAWNLKFGALWDPSKVKPLHSTHEYGRLILNNDKGYSILLPTEHMEEFKDKFATANSALWGNFDVNSIFSPDPPEPRYRKSHEQVKEWMGEKNIPWIALDAGHSNRWVVEQDETKPMSIEDYDQLIDHLVQDGFTGGIALSSRPISERGKWYQWKFPKMEDHGHEAFKKDCNECRDVMYDLMYPSTKTSALWDPTKIKPLPPSSQSGRWTALPLMFTGNGSYRSPTFDLDELKNSVDTSLLNGRSIEEVLKNDIYCPCEQEHKLDGNCRWQNADAVGNIWVPSELADEFKRNTYGQIIAEGEGFIRHDASPHVLHFEKKPNDNGQTDWDKEGWYNTLLIGGYGWKGGPTEEELREQFDTFTSDTGLRIETPKALGRKPLNLFKLTNPPNQN